MTRRTALICAAAASAVALAAAVPATGVAHPHPDGDRKKMGRVIILENKHRGEPGKRMRAFHIGRADMKCEGEATRIDEGSDRERTKILLCHDGKASASERTERLEKALSRIRSDEHLSAEHKAKVETAIEEAIAKLRSTN